MEWQDQGVLLNVRRHGESAAIIEVLTETHGLHAGLVRGGGSRKMGALLQPGTQLALSWRARLEGQLGSFSVELISSRSFTLLTDRKKLYTFNALSAMLSKYMPEREPNTQLYHGGLEVLARLHADDHWQHCYCRFELQLLEVLGYGLDLSRCAVSAETTQLHYVSPKSGRAVGKAAAVGYEPRLLPLPDPLRSAEMRAISVPEFTGSLKLTGYFFDKWIPTARPGLPEPRLRLLELLER